MVYHATPLQKPPNISIRQLARLLTKPIEQLPNLVVEYPDVFGFPLRSMPGYLVQRPEYAKHVLQENYKNYTKGEKYGVLKPMLGNGLLMSEGEFWKKHRLLTQPAFHRKRLAIIANIVQDSSQSMMEKWEHQSTINFTNEMGHLTIEIVCKALFGADIDDKVEAIRESINMLNRKASVLARLPIAKLNWNKYVKHMPKMQKAIKTLDDTIYGIIEERQDSIAQHDDLLAMLMEARYEDTGEAMSLQQLRDELMTIFIAGHETTVLSLSWTAYLLSQNPSVIKKVRTQLNDVLGDAPPGLNNLRQLNQLSNVINESMRLYPPVFVIGRKSIADDVIGNYIIPANHNVAVNIYGLHRHPDYWEQPDAFIPDRFIDFDFKGDNRFLFLPFGGGPRICIGNNFAMMEMQIILCHFIRHFDFELMSAKPAAIPNVTLRPEPSIQLKLFRRMPVFSSKDIQRLL